VQQQQQQQAASRMSARMMMGSGGATGPFVVQLGPGLVWVPNEDGTRRFLAVRVSERLSQHQQQEEEEGNDEVEGEVDGGGVGGGRGKGSGWLNRLLWACNAVVADFGFAGLYVPEGREGEEIDRSEFFHFSLAWCLASQLKGREISQEVLDEVWASTAADEVRDLTIVVDAVLVKVGNTVHRIPLNGGLRKGIEKNGILG
jgi:hypothetical protein